jgi:hypothetical protein
MNFLPITIEAMVAILLLFTILYCVRLNAQLKRLKADESAMKGIIGELIASTEKAERAIAGLRSTVREADDTLGEHLKEAERFCIEIKTSTEAGADVLNRISQPPARGRGCSAWRRRSPSPIPRRPIPSSSWRPRRRWPSGPMPAPGRREKGRVRHE